MAKNNQKKEKALRNKENARKYHKKVSTGGRRGPGRPAGGAPSAAPAPMVASAQ